MTWVTNKDNGKCNVVHVAKFLSEKNIKGNVTINDPKQFASMCGRGTFTSVDTNTNALNGTLLESQLFKKDVKDGNNDNKGNKYHEWT